MRKSMIALLCSLAVAVNSPAEEVFQCVNPDVMNALVFDANDYLKPTIRRAMPDAVTGFRAPAGFTLIGAATLARPGATTVAYKTTAEADKALASLIAFSSTEGWKRENAVGGQQPGVAATSPQLLVATLCRNGERRGLRVQDIEGVRYATIDGADIVPRYPCDTPRPQDSLVDQMASINALTRSLPQFSFPATTRMSGDGVGNAFNGNDAVSTSLRLESPDTAVTLLGNLGRQLVTQGWHGDAEWTGALSSGSTWTRRSNDGRDYVGKLEILNLGGGAYDVGFMLAAGR